MRIGNSWMERIFLSTATLGVLVFGAGIALATQDVVLTAVKGDASIQDRELGERAELAEDQQLRTGDDSGCSVLLDKSAVVELCGSTQISFGRDAKRGNRIVNVESGELRLVVEPREANERIEIHTPAAIATILGTVVYISVDPVTGATTISSSESRVNIRARDGVECSPRGMPPEPGIPECAEGATIGSLEQLTITPGERPESVKKLSQRQVDDLGGCLLDFRDLALDVDRRSQESKAVARVAEVDMAASESLPFAPGESTTERRSETETETDTEPELEPIDDPAQVEEIIDEIMMMIDPPACGPFPVGEGCSF